jgi:hypothetical protein
MKSKLMFFARLSRKRARTQARRLNVLMKQYRSDPVRNFRTHSEAAGLARSASYYLRQAEIAGRIILTVDGKRRQLFLVDIDKQTPQGTLTNMTGSTT